MGKSLNLEPFGSFRLSFGSEGVDDPADFHNSMIKHVRVIFTPGVRFKDALIRTSFERIDI
jgi:hypothetical protein